MIPDRERCLSSLRERDVPLHIIRHSEMVEKVSIFVARSLNSMDNCIEDWRRLDLSLISAGALLHDIAKISAMNSDTKHTDMGSDIVTALGFDDVAPLVRQHVFLDDYETDTVDEVSIVNYGDKRVAHDVIVTLYERFTDLYERYGKISLDTMELVRHLHRMSIILEKKIFERLPFEPDELIGLIEKEEIVGLHTR